MITALVSNFIKFQNEFIEKTPALFGKKTVFVTDFAVSVTLLIFFTFFTFSFLVANENLKYTEIKITIAKANQTNLLINKSPCNATDNKFRSSIVKYLVIDDNGCPPNGSKILAIHSFLTSRVKT